MGLVTVPVLNTFLIFKLCTGTVTPNFYFGVLKGEKKYFLGEGLAVGRWVPVLVLNDVSKEGKSSFLLWSLRYEIENLTREVKHDGRGGGGGRSWVTESVSSWVTEDVPLPPLLIRILNLLHVDNSVFEKLQVPVPVVRYRHKLTQNNTGIGMSFVQCVPVPVPLLKSNNYRY